MARGLSRFDNRPQSVIDAKEACEMLGVKPATLYTYVSRGLIRRVEGRSAGGRRYLAEDVERVRARAAARRGHEAVAAGALDFGDPVLDSALTLAGPDDLLYRGESAVALAASGARLEDAAALLWGSPIREAWPGVKVILRKDERTSAYVWRMARVLPRLAAADPERAMPQGARDVERAQRLVATFAACAGSGSRRRGEDLAETVVRGLELPAAALPALQTALLLVADHELNISTFSARVAASGGADLYACLGAALYAFTGPRHGGAAARADAWMQRLGPASGVRREVRAALDRGDEVPGFGHP
ncbi:MAG: citrate synthase, partial [Myxococcota bacterium]